MASAFLKRSSNGNIAHVQDIVDLCRLFQSSKDKLEKQKADNDLRDAIADLIEEPEQIPDTTFHWSGLAEAAFIELEAAIEELLEDPYDDKRDKRFHVAVADMIEAVIPEHTPLPWIENVVLRKPKEEYFSKDLVTFDEFADAYYQWEEEDGPYYEDNTWEYFDRMRKARMARELEETSATQSRQESGKESDKESNDESDE